METVTYEDVDEILAGTNGSAERTACTGRTIICVKPSYILGAGILRSYVPPIHTSTLPCCLGRSTQEANLTCCMHAAVRGSFVNKVSRFRCPCMAF